MFNMKKWFMKQGKEMIIEFLPDVVEWMNKIPKQVGELNPALLLSFVDDDVNVSIVFPKVEVINGAEKLIINRVYKKSKLSELDKITDEKADEKETKQIKTEAIQKQLPTAENKK